MIRWSRRHFLQQASRVGLGLGLALWAGSAAATPPAPQVPPRKPKPPKLLVLDPGHGGKDPGALGPNGLQEKNITLDMGLRLARLLAGHEQIQVRLTRDKDVFVPLQERVAMSRELGADLFLSLHADSAPNPKARGFSVYSLSDRAGDELTKALVEQEIKAEPAQKNLPDYVDPEVAAILLDITTKRSRHLALAIKQRLVSGMQGQWPILENPMRAANFVVLRAPDVPSLLIENGFLSNEADAKLLADPSTRARLADRLAKQLVSILTGPVFG